MSLIENIANNIKVLHKVKSVPTNTSKLGIHLVEGGGVYIVTKDPITPALRVVKKIYESSDYYMKGSVDSMLSAQKQLLDDADAILQSQINTHEGQINTHEGQINTHEDQINTHSSQIQDIVTAYIDNKGYFATLTSLQASYPTPEVGDTAYVADALSSTGYYIYNVVGGIWTASAVEAPPVAVPIGDYTLNGGSTKTTQEIESDIDQLESDLSIFASKYVKSHNQYLTFKGFKNTSSPQLSPVLNFAYIATESGTIMGVEAIKGQIIWGDGVSFIVEDVKQSNDFYRELQGSLFNVDGFIKSSDGSIQASELRISTDYIPINPKDDLIITGYDSAGEDNSAILAYYDKNKEFINYYTSGESAGYRRKITIESSEIPIDTKYVRVSAKLEQTDAFVNLDMGNLLDEINLQVKKIESKIDEVALTAVPIDAIGGEVIAPETNLLASLVGTDIEDSNIWGSGYFRSDGSIATATTICYSKDYIKAYKGSYNAWIATSSTRSIVIYDKEKNIIGSVQNDNEPIAYQFSFDLPEGTAYIRISHAKSQSTNSLRLNPVDVVYNFDNSIFELKGDEVELTTVPIDAIGGETITPETNLLASLVGTDIEDSDIWGSGFLRSTGAIGDATSICYSKDYIRAFKGSYNAWIAISSTYSIVIYDKERNIIGSIQNDQTPTAYQFSFDLPERTAYIRISHAKSQSTNNLKLYLVDVVYGFDNSIFELKGDDVIEVGTNFLSELINSELTNTDIWESGYLLGSGQIRESATGYYSKKYYKVAGGSYNLKAYISGGAACLVYDGSFNVISSFTTDVSPFDEPIIIPDNAVYIRISHISQQYNVKNIKLINTIPVVFQNNKILSNISKGNYDYAVNGEAVASHELEMIKRANPPKKMFPIVSFISDDGHIANINWYVPILEDHDVKSTFVVISGRKGGDYMTNEQIKELHNKGHEIGGHTKSHIHLADIPIDEAEEEIRHSALDLIDMGIEPYTFVHPFGSRNLDTDRLAREHFKISPIVTIDSTVAEGTCCNTPPIDTYGVKRLSFDSFQTYESRLQLAKDAVDVAVSNNQWLIFIIHPQYGEYNTVNPDYLSKRQDVSDLISYIKQQGARILTCKDAMHYYGNSFEVGNKRLDDIYYALGSDGNDEGNFFDRRI